MSRVVVRQRIIAWNCRARSNQHVTGQLLGLAKVSSTAVLIALETQGGRKNIGGRRLNLFANGIGTTAPHVGTSKKWMRVTGSGNVGASAQIFIRPGVRVLSWGVRHVPTRWRGPKSGWRNQKGRSYPWAVVVLNGRITLVVAVHNPWRFGVKSNRAAWRDCMLLLRSMADAYPTADVVLTGDQNVSPDDSREFTTRWLAREIGGEVVKGVGVDHTVIRRAIRGPNEHLPRPAAPTARPVGKGNSDHFAIATNP